jgi:hypothetical protein
VKKSARDRDGQAHHDSHAPETHLGMQLLGFDSANDRLLSLRQPELQQYQRRQRSGRRRRDAAPRHLPDASPERAQAASEG